MSSHLLAIKVFTASTPSLTTSAGGITRGFWSKLSLVKLSSRPNVSGRADIWLLLRSSSLRFIKSPKVSGSSFRSLKLLLKLRISRFARFPIARGRPRSSLKWASRWHRNLISQIEVGREQILFSWIESLWRFNISYPILVGKYVRRLKLTSNSSNDLDHWWILKSTVKDFWTKDKLVMNYNYLQWQMVSGKISILLLETSRIFKFCSNPIESGNASKRFEARMSSSRISNPAIESGMTCFTHTGYSVNRKNKASNNH